MTTQGLTISAWRIYYDKGKDCGISSYSSRSKKQALAARGQGSSDSNVSQSVTLRRDLTCGVLKYYTTDVVGTENPFSLLINNYTVVVVPSTNTVRPANTSAHTGNLDVT